jgi:hypothetical protein
MDVVQMQSLVTVTVRGMDAQGLSLLVLDASSRAGERWVAPDLQSPLSPSIHPGQLAHRTPWSLGSAGMEPTRITPTQPMDISYPSQDNRLSQATRPVIVEPSPSQPFDIPRPSLYQPINIPLSSLSPPLDISLPSLSQAIGPSPSQSSQNRQRRRHDTDPYSLPGPSRDPQSERLTRSTSSPGENDRQPGVNFSIRHLLGIPREVEPSRPPTPLPPSLTNVTSADRLSVTSTVTSTGPFAYAPTSAVPLHYAPPMYPTHVSYSPMSPAAYLPGFSPFQTPHSLHSYYSMLQSQWPATRVSLDLMVQSNAVDSSTNHSIGIRPPTSADFRPSPTTDNRPFPTTESSSPLTLSSSSSTATRPHTDTLDAATSLLDLGRR